MRSVSSAAPVYSVLIHEIPSCDSLAVRQAGAVTSARAAAWMPHLLYCARRASASRNESPRALCPHTRNETFQAIGDARGDAHNSTLNLTLQSRPELLRHAQKRWRWVRVRMRVRPATSSDYFIARLVSSIVIAFASDCDSTPP